MFEKLRGYQGPKILVSHKNRQTSLLITLTLVRIKLLNNYFMNISKIRDIFIDRCVTDETR